MDQIKSVTSISKKFFEKIRSEVEEVTYASIIFIDSTTGEIVYTPNNNYNGWGDIYYKESYKDCILMCVATTIKQSNQNGIIIWDDVIHTNIESLNINTKREQHGIYNGISIINQSLSNKYTIIFSLTSNFNVIKEEFHEKIIFMKDNLMRDINKSFFN